MDDKRASSSSTSVSSSIPLDDDQESLKIIVEDTGAPLQPAAPPASTDNRSHERQPNTINNPNHFIPSPSSQGKERPIADTMLAPPLNVPVKISRTMSSAEIIQHLVVHGCHDITKDLDSQSCSEYPIASGGFGDVYRGQLRNGPRVAIKCMRIFDPSDGEQQQQKHLNYAAREIHTWSKLRHPHVLRLLGLVTYREKIAMVSPWMEGGPLRHHLKRNTGVNRPQLCTKIADALSYLHQSGVVHGDLKGDNVLMDDAGEPLVTDFGNAVLQERTLNFTFVTTGNHLSSRWAVSIINTPSLRTILTLMSGA
ncbi:hypothetical protein FRC07_012331 [Ceratobasidium sp. 392]|nr:hypothetical protein FRC07_012331 [Ceratobasidium sp. 392]